MDKIKCPHCGAINQDVTEQDLCWNCSKPLTAAAAASAPTTTNGTPPDPATTSGGRVLKTQPTLEERVAARKLERAANRSTRPAIYITLVIFVLLLILLYVFFFRHHG